MKHLSNYLLICILTLVLVSCKQDAPVLEDTALVLEESSVYVFNLGGDSPVWEASTIIPAELNSLSGTPDARKQTNSAHTHGNFARGSSADPISFSGTQNNGGSHGSAVFQQTLNLPFPPFNAIVQLTLETACVTVEGNEAIYGGLITASEGSPFPGGGPFGVGRYFYFKVKDNGQGNNAPPDQYYRTLYSLSAADDQCAANLSWSSLTDVQNASDKIKVN